MRLQLSKYASPLLTLLLVTDEHDTLRALDFVDYESRMHRLLRDHYTEYTLEEGSPPTPVVEALNAYFDGDLHALDRVTTATAGTPFQRAVWKFLRTITPGTTISYGELAARIGRSSASRAVGAANGSNPIAIVVPCHRVIGASGKLTGYGGGLARKRWLIDHELRFAKEPIAATTGPVHSAAARKAVRSTRLAEAAAAG
jgi:methylated-DNA-[protein]-cysteine S-methyltransferase